MDGPWRRGYRARSGTTSARDVFAAAQKAVTAWTAAFTPRTQGTTAAGGLIAPAANRHRGKDNREAAGVLWPRKGAPISLTARA